MSSKENKMAEVLLLAFAIVLFFQIRRRRKSLQNKTTTSRKIRVRPVFQEEARRANSQYYNLAKELGLCDRECYFLPSIRFHLVIFSLFKSFVVQNGISMNAFGKQFVDIWMHMFINTFDLLCSRHLENYA